MLRNRGIRTRRDEQAEEVGAPSHPSSAQPAPQPVPQVVRTFAATGVATMDILPARSGGRGLLRRKGAPVVRTHGTGPLVPAGPAQPQLATAATAPTTPVPVLPDVAPLVPLARDAAPALPVPSAPPVTAPEPAPSSLFAPAPAPAPEVPQIVTAPPVAAIAAPSSLFLPAPTASEAPDAPAELSRELDPIGAATAPALTAAQSLRERSAMASEALSELSALSTYTSPGAPAQPPGEESLGARRGTRNAADVRSMLSGSRPSGDRGVAAATGVPVPAPH